MKVYIQSGTKGGAHDLPNWHLHEGSGTRSARITVNFEEPYFPKKPTVVVGLSSFDGGGAVNRLSVNVEAITEENFVVVFTTWHNTSIAAASVNWMAYYIPERE